MLKGDYMGQVVKIVFGGVPTVLEVRFMCRFICFGNILLPGSVSTYEFDLIRYQVHLWQVELGIQLLGIFNLMADKILPDIHFVPVLVLHPSFSICSLLSLTVSNGSGPSLWVWVGV
jgi:hypothetical protein